MLPELLEPEEVASVASSHAATPPRPTMRRRGADQRSARARTILVNSSERAPDVNSGGYNGRVSLPTSDLLRASAVVCAGASRSDVHRARGAGPLRLLTPRAGRAAWVVTSSLGGGLVDGDAVALDVVVESGATCVVTTQASTKAYRGRARQELSVRVDDGAAVLVVPDPLVPYAGSTLQQSTAITLAATGSLVLLDTLTAGRVAHGERWACDRVDTTVRLVRGGVLRLHDRVVLDRSDGSIAERLHGFDALATCVVVGPRVAAEARALLASVARAPLRRAERGVMVVASPVGDDGVLVRICGAAIEDVITATRAHLASACAALGEDPWARKW